MPTTTPRSWTVLGHNYPRTVSGPLRELLCDLPTGCQPDCFVICFADFTGNCSDIYQPLLQPLRGHSSLLREMFLGNCSDTARQLPAASPDATRDAAQLANRLLRVCQADCFLIC
ncbi:MAG TPA: hypothetical protein VHY30_07215 [Verrucomicrobiae bacterium]|nr:hypothetical protein [Verrucomicrobiae bacterium]